MLDGWFLPFLAKLQLGNTHSSFDHAVDVRYFLAQLFDCVALQVFCSDLNWLLVKLKCKMEDEYLPILHLLRAKLRRQRDKVHSVTTP